jgi:hypothetical protein
MPTIDNAAIVRAQMRERMRTLKRGDFITLDATPAASMMVVDGRLMAMRPLESDAERKAREKREWEKEFERKYLSGW